MTSKIGNHIKKGNKYYAMKEKLEQPSFPSIRENKRKTVYLGKATGKHLFLPSRFVFNPALVHSNANASTR